MKFEGELTLAKDYIGRNLNINSVLYPLQISYCVTKLCNSRCKMCNIWKYKSAAPDLTLNEIKALAQQKYMQQIMFLGLTGGEPFIRKDLAEVVFAFNKHLKHLRQISFSTNGTMTAKIEEDLLRILPKIKYNVDVTISLDGIGKAHDRIRGVKGFFSKVQGTLAMLKRLQESYPQLSIGVRFTMLPSNYKEIINIYKFAQENKIHFTSKPGTNGGLYNNEAEFSDWNKQYTPEQLKEAIGLIKSIYLNEYRLLNLKNKSLFKKVKDISMLLFLKYSINYIKNPDKQIFPCFACFSSIFLEQDGSVYSCPVLYRKLGNIREHSFDSIWQSKLMAQTRRFIKRGKCPCYTNCNQVPSLVFAKYGEIAKILMKKV